jgi:hypothetical protein
MSCIEWNHHYITFWIANLQEEDLKLKMRWKLYYKERIKNKNNETLKTMHTIDNSKNKQCNNQMSHTTNYNNG